LLRGGGRGEALWERRGGEREPVLGVRMGFDGEALRAGWP